jgi:hypothetical protein
MPALYTLETNSDEKTQRNGLTRIAREDLGFAIPRWIPHPIDREGSTFVRSHPVYQCIRCDPLERKQRLANVER